MQEMLLSTLAERTEPVTYLKNVTVDDYVRRDYANYIADDALRTIPSVCDGLKKCSRKIVWVAWERGFKANNRIKVAQLGASVAEKTMYLHGEASLLSAIVTLAQVTMTYFTTKPTLRSECFSYTSHDTVSPQDFTGTNNCSLLFPDGAFGTRMGTEASAPRYIHTYVTDFAYALLSKSDKVPCP